MSIPGVFLIWRWRFVIFMLRLQAGMTECKTATQEKARHSESGKVRTPYTAFLWLSPRTAPAPRGGVRRVVEPEHEHRRCE